MGDSIQSLPAVAHMLTNANTEHCPTAPQEEMLKACTGSNEAEGGLGYRWR